MSVLSRAASAAMKLPKPKYHALRVERDIPVRMPDGAVLLADRHAPADRMNAPIILARCPYGRRRIDVLWKVLAAQGYQVVVQSCRGTFGSLGHFEPFRNEAADGAATLEWLAEQSWFVPNVITFGPSYLGLTQWSIAADAPEWLRGMAISISGTNFRDSVVYPGDAFGLANATTWIASLETQEQSLLSSVIGQRRLDRRKPAADLMLPIATADTKLVGRSVNYFRDWIDHDQPGDQYWEAIDFSTAVAGECAVRSISMVAGWYDIFAEQQLADFTALQKAGRPARLVVGPWFHGQPASIGVIVKDALALAAEVLHGQPRTGDPVQVLVTGDDRWRGLPSWPPPSTPTMRYLRPSRVLHEEPADGAPMRFVYDPADPTPVVGGRLLDTKQAGPKDQQPRESRSDVVCFTTETLDRDITAIGLPQVSLQLRTSRAHRDLFVRLCDVDSAGVSINICDIGRRLNSTSDGIEDLGDGRFAVTLVLTGLAHTFRAGHAIRLQVSAGAHPAMSRNLGTGEPLSTATQLESVDFEIFPGQGSCLELPIVTG